MVPGFVEEEKSGSGGGVRKHKRDESSAAEKIRDRRKRYVN